MKYHNFHLIFNTDVDCGIPESFRDNTTFANVTYTSTNYLSFANYTCNSGNSLIGESVRMCTGNGTWSPAVPRCERLSATSATPPASTATTTAQTTTIMLEGAAYYTTLFGLCSSCGQLPIPTV